MKPIDERTSRRKSSAFSSGAKRSEFPIIDCSYQTFSLDRSYGGFNDKSHSSFFNISREYFRHEARRNFAVESAFFLVFAAILALAFVSGAQVIIHFLNLPAV